MYLHRKVYVGNKYRKPEQQIRVVVPDNQDGVLFPIKGINNEKISEIVEQVGYWRKSNAIHAWFVANVQGGEDDCKEYYVSEENMKELLKVVKEVLKASKLIDGDVYAGTQWTKEGGEKRLTEKGKIVKDHSVAEKLLPTTSGCFFGGTDYDQYYIEDLKETEKILEEALKMQGGEFYYQASW